jgi:hypothetical protein
MVILDNIFIRNNISIIKISDHSNIGSVYQYFQLVIRLTISIIDYRTVLVRTLLPSPCMSVCPLRFIATFQPFCDSGILSRATRLGRNDTEHVLLGGSELEFGARSKIFVTNCCRNALYGRTPPSTLTIYIYIQRPFRTTCTILGLSSI